MHNYQTEAQKKRMKCIKNCKRSLLVLTISVLCLILTSCSSLMSTSKQVTTVGVVPINPLPKIPQHLLNECEMVSIIESNSPEHIREWILDTIDQYNQCAIQQKESVEVFKLLEDYRKTQDAK